MNELHCSDCEYLDYSKEKFICLLSGDIIKPTDKACFQLLPILEPDIGYDTYEE